uniref:Uncharacterized protein n=1 Tax=Zea mays TaxID=4577 RepID=C0HIB2_MAIZE|nr:unknown [Zea mays]
MHAGRAGATLHALLDALVHPLRRTLLHQPVLLLEVHRRRLLRRAFLRRALVLAAQPDVDVLTLAQRQLLLDRARHVPQRPQQTLSLLPISVVSAGRLPSLVSGGLCCGSGPVPGLLRGLPAGVGVLARLLPGHVSRLPRLVGGGVPRLLGLLHGRVLGLPRLAGGGVRGLPRLAGRRVLVLPELVLGRLRGLARLLRHRVLGLPRLLHGAVLVLAQLVPGGLRRLARLTRDAVVGLPGLVGGVVPVLAELVARGVRRLRGLVHGRVLGATEGAAHGAGQGPGALLHALQDAAATGGTAVGAGARDLVRGRAGVHLRLLEVLVPRPSQLLHGAPRVGLGARLTRVLPRCHSGRSVTL